MSTLAKNTSPASLAPENRGSRPRAAMGRGEPLYADEPSTLAGLFIKALQEHPRPDALCYKRDGKWHRISTAEMVRRAGDIALGLYSLGLRKGDRVALHAPNSPEWTLFDAGCQFAGILDVPIYPTLAESSVGYILRDSAARVLVVHDREMYERIANQIAGSSVEKIVLIDTRGAPIDGALGIADVESAGAALRVERPGLIDTLADAAAPDDVATLIYTSGTTGEPKGVMLTHTNIISNVIDAGEKYEFSEADIPLSVLPLCHIFERSAMYLYILNGMAVHYAESIDKVPDNLQEVRPTIFVGVPRIFEKVYARARLKASQSDGLKTRIFDWAIEAAKRYALALETGMRPSATLSLQHALADALIYKKLRAFFGGRLRSCITGGAALSDDIYLIFTGAGITIFQGYGLTETSPVISSNNPQAHRLGSVGRPIRNVSVRVAADGEIEVTGPGVMLGYYNKPEATRDAFTEDGWFRTGDIGEIDEDGFLRITDRKKELFKTSGGKYIAPSPIEQMIKASKFISQAVLIGDGRKFPAALIVPNFEMLRSYARHKGLAIDSPADFCKDPRIIDLIERQVASYTASLGQYEKVKKIALIENEMTVDGGELTPTLKVRRRIVDEKYRDVIDRIYADAEKERPAG
ncbi:MAG: AMP-dependent synthetase/ligase [Pyrinomonadaceae bacterium]